MSRCTRCLRNVRRAAPAKRPGLSRFPGIRYLVDTDCDSALAPLPAAADSVLAWSLSQDLSAGPWALFVPTALLALEMGMALSGAQAGLLAASDDQPGVGSGFFSSLQLAGLQSLSGATHWHNPSVRTGGDHRDNECDNKCRVDGGFEVYAAVRCFCK